MAINLKFAIPEQFLKDLLTTCVEGGSAYWLAAQKVERDKDLNVLKIIGCHDAEGDEDAHWGDATLETMRLGLERIFSGSVKVSHTTKGNLLPSIIDPDECLWDAGDADCVLQAGLLKDIVYG